MGNKKDVSEIRTSFGVGLNKKDVMNYIEKLQAMVTESENRNVALEDMLKDHQQTLEKSEVCYTALWEKNKEQERIIVRQREAIEQYEEALQKCGELIREFQKKETKLLKEINELKSKNHGKKKKDK